jgi:hypothetical protein
MPTTMQSRLRHVQRRGGELRASYTDTAANLFASWKAWAELMGEPAISRKAFANKMLGKSGIGLDRTKSMVTGRTHSHQFI